MNEGFLSQEEIDALLRGEQVTAPAPASDLPELSDIEKDALGEIGNISMGSAATTLSVLLGRKVDITTPKVNVTTIRQIKKEYPLPYLVIEVGYTVGIVGVNLLIVRERDACIIADLMMGGDGANPPTELNELHMSAVSEAMNQMMGSTATSMSTVFRKKVDISPPNVTLLDFADDPPVGKIATEDEYIVKVAFRMVVEGLIDSEIMQILTYDVAKDMVGNLMGGVAESSKPQEPPVSQVHQPPPPSPTHQPQYAAPPPQQQYSQPQYATMPSAFQPSPNVTVQPVQFAPLTPGGMPIQQGNIGFIADVPLRVTVELGRTRKVIREILELAPGSVIELDKLAGEPVDVLVNGKLVAKGEVVVIDENFGVRVTDVVSPIERMSNIQ